MVFYIFILFCLGLISGSFINSLSYRLGSELTLKGRSFCPYCKRQIWIRDLLPLFSFLWLKSRCRFCQQKISWQYWLVELITGIIFVLVFWQNPQLNLTLISSLIFIAILLLISLIDFNYYLILDKVLWPSLILVIIINYFLKVGLVNELMGMLIGSIFFLIQYLISQGQGIGFGDVKLGILIGAMLGWKLLIVALILAYVLGAIIAIALLILKKKKFGDILPLGSFLGTSAIIVLIWGETLLNLFWK